VVEKRGPGVRKLLVRDQIAAEIRRRIAHGFYSPGTVMPTEQALAQEFGTSRTTVSRALAGIRDAGLIEMAPGRGTRVLAVSERSEQGAAGIFYIAQPPFSAKPALMIEPMQDVLRRRQQHSQLVSGPEPAATLTADDVARRFSGALFVEGLGYEPLMHALAERHFPFVVANLEKAYDFACTWVDHRKSTRTAVGFLAALGHRRIALLMRPRELFFYGQAFEGYQAGLEEAGLPFDESRVAVVEHVDSPVDSVGAFLKTQEFLKARPDTTAIVACRDYLAGGACRAATESGRGIGRDLSIIGFDDTTWPQEHPFLTTFMEPMESLGAVAAQMLIDRLVAGAGHAEKREMEAPLIVRRSVGPCLEGGAPPPGRFLLRPWTTP
jgi:DNA-binding LacI/PurR family transcriptional regulator